MIYNRNYLPPSCVAKNLHGEERATVRLYEVEKIIKPQRTNYVSRPRDIFPPTKIVPRIHTGNAQFDGNNKRKYLSLLFIKIFIKNSKHF